MTKYILSFGLLMALQAFSIVAKAGEIQIANSKDGTITADGAKDIIVTIKAQIYKDSINSYCLYKASVKFQDFPKILASVTADSVDSDQVEWRTLNSKNYMIVEKKDGFLVPFFFETGDVFRESVISDEDRCNKAPDARLRISLINKQ